MKEKTIQIARFEKELKNGECKIIKIWLTIVNTWPKKFDLLPVTGIITGKEYFTIKIGILCFNAKIIIEKDILPF